VAKVVKPNVSQSGPLQDRLERVAVEVLEVDVVPRRVAEHRRGGVAFGQHPLAMILKCRQCEC
jgi:hypothetical protein